MKLKDKVRIGNSDSFAYIDFKNHMYCFNTNERAIRLNPDEMNVLRCLCHAYNIGDGSVESRQIFKFVNGFDFDRSQGMDMQSITKKISTLRKKITKDRTQYSEEYIESPRQGVFKIILPESPFEIEKSEHETSKVQINATSSNSANSENDYFISTLDFLDKYLIFSGENKSTGVDLAFYAGTLWLLTDERTEILNQLAKHDISCRIIINEESDIITSVHKHMKNKNKLYPSISDTIKLWYEQQERFSEILKIRISPLPLLRSYCHIRNINDLEKDAIRIFHYTYGNGNLNKDCIQVLIKNSPKAEVFADEFEYLWNNSKDIKQYF